MSRAMSRRLPPIRLGSSPSAPSLLLYCRHRPLCLPPMPAVVGEVAGAAARQRSHCRRHR